MSSTSQLTSTQLMVGKSSSTYNLDVSGNGNIDGSLNVVNVITANSLNLTGVSGNTLEFNNVTTGNSFFCGTYTLLQDVPANTNSYNYATPIVVISPSTIKPVGVICNVCNTTTGLSVYVSPYNYQTGSFKMAGTFNNTSSSSITPIINYIVFY